MNKVKEKKLQEIKSEIAEITDYINTKSDDLQIQNQKSKIIPENSENTLTLTKIVKEQDTNYDSINLTNIKNELINVKLLLNKQEKLLQEIFLKIK